MPAAKPVRLKRPMQFDDAMRRILDVGRLPTKKAQKKKRNKKQKGAKGNA